MKKMKKWSGIQLQITTKSKSLLAGNPLPMRAKFGRRPFPRSSVISFGSVFAARCYASAAYAIMRCPSVCLSVCLSRS